MTIAETLLPEFDREMATTRRLIERVPEDRLAWKPHAKSMALGALSEHLGQLALWGRLTITASGVDLEQMARPPGYQPLATRAALLAPLRHRGGGVPGGAGRPYRRRADGAVDAAPRRARRSSPCRRPPAGARS